MTLTLPKWLQLNPSLTQQLQTSYDSPQENNISQQVSSKQKNLSEETPCLNYLDDYIHQWF